MVASAVMALAIAVGGFGTTALLASQPAGLTVEPSALLWEGDGFVLLYKRIEHGGFQWPRTAQEMRNLSWQEFRWLTEGLSVDQPKANKPVSRCVL